MDPDFLATDKIPRGSRFTADDRVEATRRLEVLPDARAIRGPEVEHHQAIGSDSYDFGHQPDVELAAPFLLPLTTAPALTGKPSPVDLPATWPQLLPPDHALCRLSP